MAAWVGLVARVGVKGVVGVISTCRVGAGSVNGLGADGVVGLGVGGRVGSAKVGQGVGGGSGAGGRRQRFNLSGATSFGIDARLAVDPQLPTTIKLRIHRRICRLCRDVAFIAYLRHLPAWQSRKPCLAICEAGFISSACLNQGMALSHCPK